MNELNTPMYSTAMVARLVGLTPERVHRWLRGYDYSLPAGAGHEARRQHKEPVVRRSTEFKSYASFLDLVDLLFVKKFLDYGVSLQRLRKAFSEAESILGTRHFAQRQFFTDGKRVFLQIKDRPAEALLELLSGGQWVIPEIIKHLAHEIVFNEHTDLAERWFPESAQRKVVVDPRICFGRPTVVNRGIATANVFDFYLGEGQKAEAVCSWLNLSKQEVEAAVGFERSLAAA